MRSIPVFLPSRALSSKYRIYNENCSFLTKQFSLSTSVRSIFLLSSLNRNIFTLSFCFLNFEIELNTFHYTLFAYKKAIIHFCPQLSQLHYSSGILYSTANAISSHRPMFSNKYLLFTVSIKSGLHHSPAELTQQRGWLDCTLPAHQQYKFSLRSA